MELRRSCKFVLPKEMSPFFLLAGDNIIEKHISANPVYVTTQLNSNLKENEQMKKLCRYSIIDNNKPKEKLARLGETWNHKSRMTVCATNWQMP